MIVELHTPQALHDKGRRSENEDYIYPHSPEDQDGNGRLFVVCDGVGGAEKGEEASKIVCESFADSLDGLEQIFNHDFERALEMAEYKIDEYIESHPDAEGMATTLALLVFDREGAKIVHIGDSRVYHLRQGQILFKTADHSLVHEMVVNNIITAEEARNHPKKNVVSRAIMGRSRPTRMDQKTISDVQPGDYFFLCTDGILESVTDEYLASLLSSEGDDAHKMAAIAEMCHQYSKDNFSGFLIRVKNVANGIVEQVAPAAIPAAAPTKMEKPGEGTKQEGIIPSWIAYLLIVVSIIVTIITLLSLGTTP